MTNRNYINCCVSIVIVAHCILFIAPAHATQQTGCRKITFENYVDGTGINASNVCEVGACWWEPLPEECGQPGCELQFCIASNGVFYCSGEAIAADYSSPPEISFGTVVSVTKVCVQISGDVFLAQCDATEECALVGLNCQAYEDRLAEILRKFVYPEDPEDMLIVTDKVTCTNPNGGIPV